MGKKQFSTALSTLLSRPIASSMQRGVSRVSGVRVRVRIKVSATLGLGLVSLARICA